MRYLCIMKSLSRALLALIIWVFCGSPIRAQFVNPPKYEYRAVWLTTTYANNLHNQYQTAAHR